MKRRIIVCVLVISVFFVISCSLPPENPKAELEYGVYVLGTDSTNKACFWVDGNLRYVPGISGFSESKTTDIITHDGNLYIAGYIKHNPSKYQLFLWKAGTNRPVLFTGEENAAVDARVRIIENQVLVFNYKITASVQSVKVWTYNKIDPEEYAVPDSNGLSYGWSSAHFTGTDLYQMALKSGHALFNRRSVNPPGNEWSSENITYPNLDASKHGDGGKNFNFQEEYIFAGNLGNFDGIEKRYYWIRNTTGGLDIFVTFSNSNVGTTFCPSLVKIVGTTIHFAGVFGDGTSYGDGKSYYGTCQIGGDNPAVAPITELTQFETGGSVKAMTVDGEDLYFAGLKATPRDYCYWKNGAETVLPGATGVSKILVYTE